MRPLLNGLDEGLLMPLRRWTFTLSPGRQLGDLVTRRHYRNEYAAMLQSQWLSREQIAAHQAARLRAILEHAYAYSPFYRDRLEAAGWRPGRPTDGELLGSLPPLERRDLQERLEEVSTVTRWRAPRLTRNSSGGSTSGSPVHFYSDGRSTDRKAAVYARNPTWVGVHPWERDVNLGGGSVNVPEKVDTKTRALNVLKGILLLSTLDLSDERMARYERAVRRFRPAMLYGYTDGIFAFAQYLNEQGRTLPVRTIVTSAEQLYDEWREPIERAFTGRLYQAYGCRETSHIAYSCGTCGVMHLNEDNLIVEVDQQTSEILVTDLYNRATPLVRYRVGDVVTISDAPSSCGRGLRSLASLEGRAAHVIEIAGRRRVAGVIFPSLLREYAHIRAYQVWQPAPDRLQLLIQSSGDPPTGEIIRRLSDYFEGVSIEVLKVDSIPTTAALKRPLFIHDKEYTGQTTTTIA